VKTSESLAPSGDRNSPEHTSTPRNAPQGALRLSALSAIVCPLTVRELPAALTKLALWNTILAPSTESESADEARPRLIYSFNCAPDDALTKVLVDAFDQSETVRRGFASIDVRFCSLPPEKDIYLREGEVGDAPFGRKAGPNWLFYETMRALRDEARFVFLMETDCEPVAPNWIRKIQRVCLQNQDAWIVGSPYCGASPLHWSIARHINGNALYNVGDQRFWEFLEGEFWPWLNAYAATSMPDLAYDCAWETYLNRVEMEDASSYEWVRARDILHRFRLSSFVVNIGGTAEQAGEYVWTRDELIKRFPGVAVVHGPMATTLDHRRGPLAVGTPHFRGSAAVEEDGGLLAHGDLSKSGFRRSVWIVGRPLDEACTVAIEFTMHCVKPAGVTGTVREPSGRAIGSQRLSGAGFGNPTRERFAHAITSTVPFVRIALTFHGPENIRIRLSDVTCEISRDGEIIWRASRILDA
jgi:hypothetical protein